MRRRRLKTLEEQVAPSHTAVLVIDMQNTFFAEESKLGDYAVKQALIPRLRRFIDKARAKHLPLVFVRMVQTDDDAGLRMRRPPRRRGPGDLRPGSKGAELIPEIQSKSGDILIEKTRYNAFLNTPLEARLRSRGISTVIVTGAYTNVCVGMTACDGSMRNFYVVVPEDLVAGTDEHLHKSALENIGRFFGTVTSSEKLLKIWGG